MALKKYQNWFWISMIGLFSVCFLPVILYRETQKFPWRMRYEKAIQKHRKKLESYIAAHNIKELYPKENLHRWYVVDLVQAQKVSISAVGILKFSRNTMKNELERIVAWYDKEGVVVRYLILQRDANSLQDGQYRHYVKIPISMQEFESFINTKGFTKNCHALLLDLENASHGFTLSTSYKPSFYYEVEVCTDLWFYWETDAEGNVLAFGLHDSP